MTPDWRAIVRAHVPPLALEQEPEILDELAQHLSDVYDEALASGRTADEALAVATATLTAERERLARDVVAARRTLPTVIVSRWTADVPAAAPPRTRILADLRRDVIYALRSLRQAPGYATVAILTLALGIGANAAIFAAVDAILLRPMPYPNAGRLVVPVSEHAGKSLWNASVSYADYLDWRRETAIFSAVAAWQPFSADLTGAGGQPERLTALAVTPEFFQVLTVTPVAGRTLQPADHSPDAPRVIVLTHGLWQRTFGGASDVVGRTVRFGGVPREIVGVLPDRAAWPEDIALYAPLRPATFNADTRERRDNLIFQAIALLRDDATLEQGNAALSAIATRLERDFPESRKGWTNHLVPLRESMVDEGLRIGLWVLLAAVGAVLLIACANLAHLGLVRGLARQRELGIRLALGASRWRLVRQIVVEGLVIASVGGAAALALGAWMIRGLRAMAPPGTPFIEHLALDGRVLLATAVLAVAALFMFSLLPAATSTRVRPARAIRDGSPSAGTSRRVRTLRHGLVILEIAGAVVLLVGAALLLRSFWRIQQVHSGVDADRVLAARIALPRGTPRYESDAATVQFYASLIDRLKAVPGVESAGATSFVPVGGGGFGLGRVFLAEGWPEPPGGPDVGAQWNVITPDYFGTMGIPLVSGRAFTQDDAARSTPVMIVSRSFAAQMFGADNPLGRRARSWRDENVLREIVGVVDEVRYEGLAEREALRQVYVPHTQNTWGSLSVVVRSKTGSPRGLESVLRRELAALDPDLALAEVRSLDDIASRSVSGERYGALLISLLALTALSLGAVGIYGLISHAVSMRRQELGLRAALGASPGHLYRLVFGQGLWLTAIGLALGLAGAYATGRTLDRLLYETQPRDPAAYAVTILVIVGTALLACVGPARRAARADPLSALRVT
jgi:putative ABC transport system permease protein